MSHFDALAAREQFFKGTDLKIPSEKFPFSNSKREVDAAQTPVFDKKRSARANPVTALGLLQGNGAASSGYKARRTDADRRPARPVIRPNDYAMSLEQRMAESARRLAIIDAKKREVLTNYAQSISKFAPVMNDNIKAVIKYRTEVDMAKAKAALVSISKGVNTVPEMALALDLTTSHCNHLLTKNMNAGNVRRTAGHNNKQHYYLTEKGERIVDGSEPIGTVLYRPTSDGRVNASMEKKRRADFEVLEAVKSGCCTTAEIAQKLERKGGAIRQRVASLYFEGLLDRTGSRNGNLEPKYTYTLSELGEKRFQTGK